MSVPQNKNASATSRSGKKKQPLYRSITDTLRRRLIEGNIASGERLPALRELANQFNVSTITVRQALRMLEQEGHLRCIPGVGAFVKSTLIRKLITDQITVAFATSEIEGAFTSQIAHYIEESCQQRGWSMQIFSAQGNPELEARNFTRMTKSGANAAIILPVSDQENVEEMVKLKFDKFPFVLVDRPIAGLKVDVVASEHEKGAYMATEYLLQNGHRQVLMVTDPPYMMPISARVRGYENALIDHGLLPLREWKIWIDREVLDRAHKENRSWIGGCEAALPVLKKLDKPIAIFAHNSYSGWGVFEACRALGLKVPDEVSIVCFDDSEFTRALSPPMTAIAQRTEDIGRLAVELLESRLASGGKDEHQQIFVDVDLVERGSVAKVNDV